MADETFGEEDDGVIDFVSFGMFIIDEIEYLPPKPPVRDAIGGAGAYAALGARLFSPPPRLSRTVGWIVDQGVDFPPAMAALIASWQTAVVMRYDGTRETTRRWNGYDVAEKRSFRYTTAKRRLTAADLPPSSLLTGRAFHIVSSAARCRELVTDLMARRREAAADAAASNKPVTWSTRPIIVWEPVPDRCTPDELLDCTNTLPLIDVCSPNHAELAAYMGDPDGGMDPVTGQLSKAAVERACEQLLSSMPLQSYALVVRAAEHGCYVAKNGGRRRKRGKRTERGEKGEKGEKEERAERGEEKEEDRAKRGEKEEDRAKRGPKGNKRPPKSNQIHGSLQPDTDMEALLAGLVQDAEGAIAREEIEVDPGLELWLPAVFGPDSGKDIVDPTGAGNAFLGATATGLARGRSLEEAAAWGNVAASFALEQVGVPILGYDSAGQETWNGERVERRWETYKEKLEGKGIAWS